MTRLARARAAELTFERVLAAVEQELVAATDEEIAEAAKDLRMDLGMKGSAAFIGLKYPSRWTVLDFFDLDELQAARDRLDRFVWVAKPDRPATPSAPPDRRSGCSEPDEE